MKKTKEKKLECAYHQNDREIDEYVFSHTCITKKMPIDVYECKKCKKHREHNAIQQEKSRFNRNRKYEEKKEQRLRSIQDDLWDFFIKDELAKGIKLKGYKKALYKKYIPKDILRLKRASMRLERLIDNIKKGIKTKGQLREEKEHERQERLQGILVNCKKHGALLKKDVIKGGKSRWTGEQRYKCRKCMSSFHKDNYIRKKDYILNKQSERRKNYPEKVREIKKKSWEKCNVKNI